MVCKHGAMTGSVVRSMFDVSGFRLRSRLAVDGLGTGGETVRGGITGMSSEGNNVRYGTCLPMYSVERVEGQGGNKEGTGRDPVPVRTYLRVPSSCESVPHS